MGCDVRQVAQTQGCQKGLGLRGTDRLGQREPQLDTVDARDRNRRCWQPQVKLDTLPGLGQRVPVGRPGQLQHQRAHPALGIDQARRRGTRAIATVRIRVGKVEALKLGQQSVHGGAGTGRWIDPRLYLTPASGIVRTAGRRGGSGHLDPAVSKPAWP